MGRRKPTPIDLRVFDTKNEILEILGAGDVHELDIKDGLVFRTLGHSYPPLIMFNGSGSISEVNPVGISLRHRLDFKSTWISQTAASLEKGPSELKKDINTDTEPRTINQLRQSNQERIRIRRCAAPPRMMRTYNRGDCLKQEISPPWDFDLVVLDMKQKVQAKEESSTLEFWKNLGEEAKQLYEEEPEHDNPVAASFFLDRPLESIGSDDSFGFYDGSELSDLAEVVDEEEMGDE